MAIKKNVSLNNKQVAQVYGWQKHQQKPLKEIAS